jgi:threonyl-tRNA synthetase
MLFCHKEYCLSLLKKLDGRKVRAEVDDSDETLGKKIRAAEKDWVPFIAVVGDKEMESGKLMVTLRSTGEKKEMSLEELAVLIEKENEKRVFQKLSLPALLSKRPVI